MERTRRRKGSRGVDVSHFRELIESLAPAPSLAYGVVYKPTGESSHAEISDDDVLVHVRLMPNETPVIARLFTAAAGAGAGVWKVPREGAEVLVALPGDDVEAGPVIVAVSPTGQVPSSLDDKAMTIDNPDGDIIVNGGSKKVARVDDTLTASAAVKSWASVVETAINSLAPGTFTALNSFGSTSPTAPGADGGLGKINSGADKFKA